MCNTEGPDWDKIRSVDNHSLDKLTPEELAYLEEYERQQTEIRDSGVPLWISEMYSNSPVQEYECAKCGKRFVRPGDPGDEYCSLACMYNDQI